MVNRTLGGAWAWSCKAQRRRFPSTMKVNPWEPDIHHYEDLVISENPEMKTFGSTSPVKVVLSPPHSPRSLMKFGGSGKPARDKGENGQMIMWKYIEGNRISKALNLKVSNTNYDFHVF